MRTRTIAAAIVIAMVATACSDPDDDAGGSGGFSDAVNAAQVIIDEVAVASGFDLGDLRLFTLTERCGPVDQILRGPEAVLWTNEVAVDPTTREAVLGVLEAVAVARGMDLLEHTGFLALNGPVPSDPLIGSRYAIGRIQLTAGEEPSPVIVTVVLGDEIDLPEPPAPALCG